MYAIIKDGGHQYRVTEGETLLVERRDLPEGSKFDLGEVILFHGADGIRVGTPTVTGTRVVAAVLGEDKGEKKWAFFYRRRKDSRVKKGHRQRYTRVKIKAIQVAG